MNSNKLSAAAQPGCANPNADKTAASAAVNTVSSSASAPVTGPEAFLRPSHAPQNPSSSGAVRATEKAGEKGPAAADGQKKDPSDGEVLAARAPGSSGACAPKRKRGRPRKAKTQESKNAAEAFLPAQERPAGETACREAQKQAREDKKQTLPAKQKEETAHAPLKRVQTRKTAPKTHASREKGPEYQAEFAPRLLAFFDVPPFKVTEVMKKDGSVTLLETASELPTFAAFARDLGVTQSRLMEWEEQHPEFAEAAKKARDLQGDILIQNSLRGNYSSSFAVFTAKNILGWSDGKDETKPSDKPLVVRWEK